MQISFSFLGLLLFVIFPCLCWLYILPFPSRSLPSLCCFFRANVILVACFVLCVAWDKALLGFSIRSRQSAPRELAHRLCFVPREWLHILSVCGVCCMFYSGWSVVCFLLDNAPSGCMCAWYRLNVSRPCFGRMVASVVPDLSSW